MDEDKQLPPSGFLSTSIRLPAGPSAQQLSSLGEKSIPPCIRHLCWRVFLTDQLRPKKSICWISKNVLKTLNEKLLKRDKFHWISGKSSRLVFFTLAQNENNQKGTRSQRHLERYSSRPKVHAGPFFPFGWLHPPSPSGPRSKLLLLSRASWCFFTF